MTILCSHNEALTPAMAVLIILLTACILKRDFLYDRERRTIYSLVTTCVLITSCLAIGSFHMGHVQYPISPDTQITVRTNFGERPTVTFEGIKSPVAMNQAQLETLQSMLGDGIPVEIETAVRLFGNTEELESLTTQKEREG